MSLTFSAAQIKIHCFKVPANSSQVAQCTKQSHNLSFVCFIQFEKALQCLLQLETFSFYEGWTDNLGKHTDRIRGYLTKLLANKHKQQSVVTEFFHPIGSCE
jgi:hypothetical protein